jgi:hypothetical protein
MENFDKEFADYFATSQSNAAVEDTLADMPAAEPQPAQPMEQSLRRRVTLDIGAGLAQAPRSIARGAVKGVNSMMEFMQGAADLVPVPGFVNPEGDFSYPRLMTQGEERKRIEKGIKKKGGEVDMSPIKLPVPDKPVAETVTGGLIEGVTQFLTGLGAVGRIGKAAGLTATGAGASIAKGAAADVLAFTEHDQRLSNVIEQIPELRNPVTEYLKADPTDTFAEGKLKQAIEGVATGAVGEALGRGISLYKKGRAAAAQAKAAGATSDDILKASDEILMGQKITPEDFSAIGDINNPELIIKKFHKTPDIVDGGAEQIAATKGKLEQAAKESSGVTPGKKLPAPGAKEPEIKINFARIQGEDDVKRLMQEMANDPALISSVQKSRRGKQTVEMTVKGADDIDGFDELLTRRQGEAFNDQQIVAARRVYYDTTSKLLEVAEKAASPQATELDQYAFRQMVAVHHAVQKEMLGARAEAGRALRAWAIPLEGTDGEKIKAIQQMLNGYGGAEASKEMASKLTMLSKAGGLNTSQINRMTQGGALARTGAALREVWKMGLLTSPRTHIVNVTSNVMTGLTLAAERGAQAVLSKDEKVKAEAVQFFVGYIGSFRQALSNSAKAFKTGETGAAFGKIELPPIRATSREVLDPEGKMGIFSKAIDYYGQALNKTVGASLAAGDEFGKTLLYNAQLRASAMREATSKGLKGEDAKKFMVDFLANPSEIVRSESENFAKYGTYNTELTGTSKAFQNLVTKVPAARFVVPFVRTPINIFKFTFERTPLAILSKGIREDIAAGGMRKSAALTKIGMGSSFMMLGTDMALNGEVTGAGPANQRMRQKLLNTGWKPYSIKINDKYYSYARFEPFATWVGMSADMTEILSNYDSYDMDEQEEVDGLATAMVAAMANQVVGKTFMSGFADLTSVLSDPKRYGDQFIQSYGRSLIPNVVADIERGISPETEQIFNMMDAIKSRIPGLSDSVGKKYNVYGEVIKAYYPSPENKALAFGERVLQAFNPVAYEDQDAPKQPIDEYFLKHGLQGIGVPDKIQKFSVRGRMGSYDSVPVNLREYPKIYERFMQLRGEVKLPQYYNKTMKEYLNGLINKKVPGAFEFHSPLIAGTDAQQNIIRKIQQDYDSAIREKLMVEFSVLKQAVSEEQRKAEQIIERRKKAQ